VKSSTRIRLDLNNPVFQESWFKLPKDEAERLRRALQKLAQMTWQSLYESKGFHLEEILSKTGPQNQKLYTIRITQKFRAVVFREQDFLRFLTLHPDHDSAYH
jgi:hypothetical protein